MHKHIIQFLISLCLALCILGQTSEYLVLKNVQLPNNINYQDIENQTALNSIKSIITLNSGSGVIIQSTPKNGYYENYALSNFHVVDGVSIHLVTMIDQSSHTIVRRVYPAFVIATGSEWDLSLVKFMTTFPVHSAKLISLRDFNKLKINTRIHTVGCGVGLPPYATYGNIANFSQGISGGMIVTSPIIWGNSGGGVFTKDGELIGVINSLIVHISKTDTFPITHLANAIPANIVHNWLSNTEIGK